MKHMLSFLLTAIGFTLPIQTNIPCSLTESEQPKVIYLTFDDGPTDSTTPKILDILHRETIPATFFVIGQQIEKREKILQRIYNEGHSIGIHTYTHDYQHIYSSKNNLLNDITLCKAAIRTILPNWHARLYRFPGGETKYSKQYIPTVEQQGLTVCGWNASAEDAVLPRQNAETLFQNAIESAGNKPEIILLLHDGVQYYSTVECVPKIIRYYKNKGYIFRSL